LGYVYGVLFIPMSGLDSILVLELEANVRRKEGGMAVMHRECKN
jgi:aryl carrier-like protein